MTIKPTSIIPDLLKQIFKKYIQNLEELTIIELRNHKYKVFLIELHAIFGEVLDTALRLLDDQQIIVYGLNSKLREVVEITEHRNSAKVIKIYPDVNFCTCDYFLSHVLNLPFTESCTTPTIRSYTCAHVLAMFLIKQLKLPVIREEILPKHNFNYLLSGMMFRMHHSKSLYEKGILKNLNMLTQSQYSNFKFVGRLDHIKTFYAGIKAINFGENGSFQINEDGFRVSAEHGKCVQANLYITTSCFSEYHVNGIVNFSLNMNVISECLGIFSGIDCSIKMFYKGQGAPMIIVMEPHDEDNITTECSIKTTHHEEPMDFILDEDSPSLNVIFIRGPDLAIIFHEFDKSAEELEITLSPRKPHFKIETLGVMQSESSIEVAKTSDMMMLFNCRDITTSRYKCSQIRMTLKALSSASKVAMKTDSSGLLEMHFMIQSEEQAEVYIQFFITPLAEIML